MSSSNMGFALGFIAADFFERQKLEKNKSDYEAYVRNVEKIVESEYEELEPYVDIFTTEKANQETFKIQPIVVSGISVDDVNYQLMLNTIQMNCDTVVGITYQFQQDSYASIVIGSGTIATTDKTLYEEFQSNKQDKRNALIQQKKLLEQIVKKYQKSGYREADEKPKEVTLSLVHTIEEETVKKGLMGGEKKEIDFIYYLVDIFIQKDEIVFKKYKNKALVSEDKIPKNIEAMQKYLDTLEVG